MSKKDKFIKRRYELNMNIDNRGSFTEFIKTIDRGQVSINISKPGITKGNHWHHTKNEKFLVRIADTDKIKNIEGKDTEIMMILEKFAIGHDLVYHQSQHLNIHQQLALRLLKEKKSKNFDSSIIMNSDNTLTENFASACDDMLSEINFIICEETELINTEKQIYIKSSLGYTEPTEYIYIPTIENKITIKELFEQGFIPDAILNYLILLDNPKAPKEIFTLPEAIEWFDLNNISKESVKFDINKLRFINHEHIKMMDDKNQQEVEKQKAIKTENQEKV
jgi:glutamyl/glutaminyl-tRNA synthetase